MRAIRWGLMVAVLACGAGGLQGQQRDRRPGERGEMEQRVRERFGELVREELGLSQDELHDVDDIVQSFQEQRRLLAVRQIRLRQALVGPAVRDSEPDARDLLREMAALRVEEARLFGAEMDALLVPLTPVQLLRFYQLREDLVERVRRLRGGGPPRRGPPGPPGGGR